jgi:hypothetical protein
MPEYGWKGCRHGISRHVNTRAESPIVMTNHTMPRILPGLDPVIIEVPPRKTVRLSLFDKLVEKLRYRLVKVASVAGKGRETASQLSQSRTFPPVQVVNDHWDVLPTASKSQ